MFFRIGTDIRYPSPPRHWIFATVASWVRPRNILNFAICRPMSLACFTADLLRAEPLVDQFANRPSVLIRVEVVAVFLHGREFEATSGNRRYQSGEHGLEECRGE